MQLPLLRLVFYSNWMKYFRVAKSEFLTEKKKEKGKGGRNRYKKVSPEKSVLLFCSEDSPWQCDQIGGYFELWATF